MIRNIIDLVSHLLLEQKKKKQTKEWKQAYQRQTKQIK